MRLFPAILVLSMPLLWGCAAKHISMPNPVVGVDIAQVEKGQPSPINGIVFSQYYLNQYLQWDCKDQGRC